jgi:hypothetical protein
VIPDLISGKLAFGAGVAGLVAVLAVGAWGSVMMIERNVARADAIEAKSKLALERDKVRGWSAKFDDLKKFTGEQTQAIARLIDAQLEAERVLAAERQAAARTAQPHKDQAREIARYQPPPGQDPAEATRLYIDGLLRKERAAP